MEALAGRRLLVPDLNGPGVTAQIVDGRLLPQIIRLSNDLPRYQQRERLDGSHLAEIVDSVHRPAPQSAEAGVRLRSFRDAVAESGGDLSTSWQHADLAVGNVLMHRGDLRLLDWEHASERSQPWFDLAQSGRGNGAAGQAPIGRCVIAVRGHVRLGEIGLAGQVLRAEIERSWDNRMPLGWVIALSSMATAIRQADDARMGADDWTEFARSRRR